MMVGEQPGDKEDLVGLPFIGPAGQLLDRALSEAGLEHKSIYLTNAVKHFKNEQRGRRRLHKRPDRDEVEICRWWLDQEIAALDPELIVALGVTAASSLMGRTVVLTRERGQLLHWRDNRPGLATIHPSAVLRMPGDLNKQKGFSGLVGDLKMAAGLLKASPKKADQS
jgi:uracil-DNA glycosylase